MVAGSDAELEKHDFSSLQDDAVLWRYLEFTRLVDLLRTAELHFARADSMDDLWEGALGRATVARRQEDRDARGIRQMLASLPELYGWSRKTVYLNCWHRSEYESAAMWAQYGATGRGAAIMTTGAQLKAALLGPHRVVAAEVRYVDYGVDQSIKYQDSSDPYRFKRRSFEHEREVRLVVQLLAGPPDDSVDTPEGLRQSVDNSKLINEIRVSPKTDDSTLAAIRDVCSHYTAAPVSRSELDDEAIY